MTQTAPTAPPVTVLGTATSGVRLEVAAQVGGDLWLAGAGARSVRVIRWDSTRDQVTAVLDIAGSSEVWGAAVAGGQVLIATGAPALLVCIDAATATVASRHPIPDDTAWCVAVAPDGAVFVGSSPGGTIWRHEPGSDDLVAWVTLGEMPCYVRDLVATDAGVLCGTGPRAGLFWIDRRDASVVDLTPDSWGRDLTFVRTCRLVDGIAIAGTTPRAMLTAVDLSTRAVVGQWRFDHGEPYVTGIHPSGGRLWITTTRSNSLWAMDRAALTDPGLPGPDLVTVTPHGASALGSLPDGTVWVMQDGLALVDPSDGSVRIPSLGSSRHRRRDAARALCWADGQICVAGESGLHLHRDDRPGAGVAVAVGDVDCLASGNGQVLLGGMSNAEVRSLAVAGTEPSAPWVVGHQQRQVTAIALQPGTNDGYLGTRPDYGAIDGAVVQFSDGEPVRVLRGLLPEQSITAVAVVESPGPDCAAVIGGSVDNGDGTVALRSTAQLGLLPGQGSELVWCIEPLAGARAIVSIAQVGAVVVGVTDQGTAFGVDVESGAVEWTCQVARSGGRLAVLGSTVYGTDGELVWAIDVEPEVFPRPEVLLAGLRGVWSGVPSVVTDGESALFTLRGNQLVRIDLDRRGR